MMGCALEKCYEAVLFDYGVSEVGIPFYDCYLPDPSIFKKECDELSSAVDKLIHDSDECEALFVSKQQALQVFRRNQLKVESI